MNVHDDRTSPSPPGRAGSELPTQGRRAPRSHRAEVRRRALLEAALVVIGREGIDAVSHRRVAEVASVPLGSTTYYFNSREEMLVQALEYFARGEIDQLREVFGGVTSDEWAHGGPAAFVERLVTLATPQLGDERWRALAQYALFQESARRPELRHIVQEWNEAWWEILSTVLAALGRPSERIDAQVALSMLDGLLLAGIALPQDDYIDVVLRPALERWLGVR